MLEFFEALIDSVGRLFWLCALGDCECDYVWDSESMKNLSLYKGSLVKKINPDLDAFYKCFTTVAKVIFLLVWSAFMVVDYLLIFCLQSLLKVKRSFEA